MSELPTRSNRLDVPQSLRDQLHGYQKRVWTIKMVEAAGIAAVVILLVFFGIFLFDRLWDTPSTIRVIAFLGVIAALSVVPWSVQRWVWNHRSLDQLARLLSRRLPHIGDQLLGIIELSRNDREQARSRDLCAAAIEQVAHAASKRDLLKATPPSRHQLWGSLAASLLVVTVGLSVVFPGAVVSAWARMLAPWSTTPRYTFAQVQELPKQLVVPHGEPFPFEVQLTAASRWEPDRGSIQVGEQLPINAALSDGRYRFDAPALISATEMQVRIGDFYQTIQLEPMLRPELKQVHAVVQLPDYLQHTDAQQQDARAGNLNILKGSRATLHAIANRDLVTAMIDDESVTPKGSEIPSPELLVDTAKQVTFDWRDANGLTGKEPFRVSIQAIDDEAPTLACENLPKQAVVLESELLKFVIHTADDFGIRQVGITWRSAEESISEISGEKVLAAGGTHEVSLETQATFSAASLGIPAQPIELRAWAEDYYPDRGRVYTEPHVLYVLTSEQHAIWMAEQLNKWHRQSLEVRDRELQLYETNKQLRELSEADLELPENRQKLETQAAGERANGRRLSALTGLGEQLIRQAQRNPDIGVGHLEKWAEMLQILKDISGNRMPTVAAQLKGAAAAKAAANPNASNAPQAPSAGNVKAAGAPKPSGPKEGPEQPPVPQVADVESSQQPANEPDESKPSDQPSKTKKGRLGLTVTTLIGPGGKPSTPPPSQKEQVDEAVTEQEGLLEEFEKIADELSAVLANLEGSTIVKRLKAASRQQDLIGGKIQETVTDAFARDPSKLTTEVTTEFQDLAAVEAKGSDAVSLIMDDMQAYFERRRMKKFEDVLKEMKDADVVGGLRQLGLDVPVEQGLSIAQCEYWSDVLDRWAEDLVDPACEGCCPGGKTPDSLPPSVVLEVLQILEGEVNLREETRVADQAKAAVTEDAHAKEAQRLSQVQDDLDQRIQKVIKTIEGLPKPQENFGKELTLLAEVDEVMQEATEILGSPETGNRAIAAETEAIELLLQSKRINPKSGGGGGSTPGGGGNGETQDSALALIGVGTNEKEVREDRGVSQATGETGKALPAEFRAGLDEYFNRLKP